MPSERILSQKKEYVKELQEKMKNSQSFILVDYRGLTVEQDTEMRNALRKAGVEYRVVKNSLTRLAAKANNIEGLETYLEGPTAIAFSETDMIAPAKLMTEYAKKYEKLEIKVGYVDKKVVGLEEIKALAELPPKEVLIAKVLGGFNAPIAGFVNVLNANLRGLVLALNAIKEKMEKAS